MYAHKWRTFPRFGVGCFLALLLLTLSAEAQLNVGDKLSMNMNGYMGAGYSGDFGNSGLSGHGLNGSGQGNLSGSYYNPNFLSFNVRPFYNRNQDNGSFASVLSETGIDASTSIFSGSHFPGAVSFSKEFVNGSQYGIPGAVTGLTSDSAVRNFSISWSELLPGLPSLTATFSDNSSSSTILGVDGSTDTASKNFNLISNYRIDGWQVMGLVNHQNIGITLPSFLSPSDSHTDSAGTSYGISATHALPLSGSFTANYIRTDYSSNAATFHNTGVTDTADTTASIQPTDKFTISGQFRYTGNLFGALQQSFIPDGTPPLIFETQQKSHGLLLGTYGTYNLGHGFMLIGYANRQMQTFAGVDYDTNRVGGTLTYSYARPLFGVLYLSFGMVNNATNSGGGSLGFVGSASLRKRFKDWQVDSDFSYAQNVQTIIASYTTSTYNYGAMVKRQFGANMYWTASYRGLQTGLTQYAGFGNRSDSFITTFRRGRWGLSGNYSQSHGTALLSTTGALTPTPLAPLISPDQIIYDGKVYGAGFNVVPLRRMLINVNWYRVNSDTLTAQLASPNNSQRYYGQMQYNLRRLSFRAGYWRVYQSVGFNLFRPVTDNTYYFNISRWFDLF